MKRYSEACKRNQVPILNVLDQYFSNNCRVLEVASGTGQHAEFFTSQQSGWIWQPSDIDPESIASIEVYRRDSGCENFLSPILLSTLEVQWDLGGYDAAFCCNMIHISSFSACEGLFCNMRRHLISGGKLLIYGPFFRSEVATAPSNLSFDRSLKARNSAWGIRHLEEVKEVASESLFEFVQVHEMPANNLIIVFEAV